MAVMVVKNGRLEYSVSAGVGFGCLNYPADVLLVQYFLSLAANVSHNDGGMRTNPPLGGALVLDGQYGPKTHYWSLYYLMYACRDLRNEFNVQAFFLNHTEKVIPKTQPMARLVRAAEFALGTKEWAALPDSPRTPVLLRQALKKAAPKGGARPVVKV
jgi:hypothetical protein